VRLDRAYRKITLDEFLAMDFGTTIAFVDPVDELTRTFQRTGPDS